MLANRGGENRIGFRVSDFLIVGDKLVSEVASPRRERGDRRIITVRAARTDNQERVRLDRFAVGGFLAAKLGVTSRRRSQPGVERIAGIARQEEVGREERNALRLEKNAAFVALDVNRAAENALFTLVRENRVRAFRVGVFRAKFLRFSLEAFDFGVERVDFLLERERVFGGVGDRRGAERFETFLRDGRFGTEIGERFFGGGEAFAFFFERGLRSRFNAVQFVGKPSDRVDFRLQFFKRRGGAFRVETVQIFGVFRRRRGGARTFRRDILRRDRENQRERSHRAKENGEKRK